MQNVGSIASVERAVGYKIFDLVSCGVTRKCTTSSTSSIWRRHSFLLLHWINEIYPRKAFSKQAVFVKHFRFLIYIEHSKNILINIFCINFELLGNWPMYKEFFLPHSMKHGLIRWHAPVVGMMWCRSMMIQMIQRMRRRMVRMMWMMRVRIMIYSMVIRATNSIPISHYDHHFETKHTFWIITFVNSSDNNCEEKYQHL